MAAVDVERVAGHRARRHDDLTRERDQWSTTLWCLTPHALALAARLPDRVIRARCDVGVAPYDVPDLDWLAGMDPENVKEFGWAQQGERVLHNELTREAAAEVARVASDPSKILDDSWQLSESDRRVLANSLVQQVIREAVPECFAAGVWGWVDDDLAFLWPWGFDVSEIGLPVEVRYGSDDVLTPPGHGAWLADHVPGATITVETGRGHLDDPAEVLDLIRTFVHAD